MKYDEWLGLAEGEKDNVSLTWNVYDGEGFNLALMALARLVDSSALTVVTANVGIYHGGVYLLSVTVSATPGEAPVVPFVSRHEGFPVIWFGPGNEWLGGFRMGGG